MPELPEVEHLRQTLETRLLGRGVTGVRLSRRDIVRNRRHRTRVAGRELLGSNLVAELRRHGKQLAIVGDSGAAMCVHLGMSGQLRVLDPGRRLDDPRHVHCVWRLDDGARLVFRDPRRFGGIWVYASLSSLVDERWAALGPDAITIRAAALARGLVATRRSIKAALLDQRVLAGVGNIYADEALFAARIHPASMAGAIGPDRLADLAREIRRVLRRAVRAGGSTLRDYVDAGGRAGSASRGHLVYGRSGLPCSVCGHELETFAIAQRTTVACPACQGRPAGSSTKRE